MRLGDLIRQVRDLAGTDQYEAAPRQQFKSGRELINAVKTRREEAQAFKALAQDVDAEVSAELKITDFEITSSSPWNYEGPRDIATFEINGGTIIDSSDYDIHLFAFTGDNVLPIMLASERASWPGSTFQATGESTTDANIEGPLYYLPRLLGSVRNPRWLQRHRQPRCGRRVRRLASREKAGAPC